VALLGWVMMGIALWHFTVFLPDRFWGGIVGAFLGAVVGSVLAGLLFHAFSLPSQEDTTILTVLEAVPGALLGMAVIWLIGLRQEQGGDPEPGGAVRL
jgi:predicted membrane-bound spermidine synthase